MIPFKAFIPFQNPTDTLDFFEVCKNPKLLIEKELKEKFETFGSYYPLYLEIGSVLMEIHNAHEVLIEALLAFIKFKKQPFLIKIPYFVQFDVKDPINLILEFHPKESNQFLIKHYLGHRDGSWLKNRPLRKKYNHSIMVPQDEFIQLWDNLAHQFFFLILKLYGPKNVLIEHYRFINTLMLWDSYKTEHPLPYPVPERKYMELHQIFEHYTKSPLKEESELAPILEEIVVKLYQPVLEPWIQELGEIGIFMGQPIISKKEEIESAISQYIFLTYPDSERLMEFLGKSFLKI